MAVKLQADIWLIKKDKDEMTIKKIGTVYTPYYAVKIDGNGQVKVEVNAEWDGC